MTTYGEAALLAVELIRNGETCEKAWKLAISESKSKESVQNKSCPRLFFLALCGCGLIDGIEAEPSGSKATKSKEYAKKAVSELINDPSLSSKPRALWEKISDRDQDQGRMDIVCSLWKNNLIKH